MLTGGLLVEIMRIDEIAVVNGVLADLEVLFFGRATLMLSQIHIGPSYKIGKYVVCSFFNEFELFIIDIFVDIQVI